MESTGTENSNMIWGFMYCHIKGHFNLVIFRVFIIRTEIMSQVFFTVFCLVAHLYKTEEVLALIWSSGLIIMIRGKRAI